MENVAYYYSSLIINSIFLVFFLGYFILFITYALYSLFNKHSTKLVVCYWLEYGISNILILIYITTYLIYLSHIKSRVSLTQSSISCFDDGISSYCLSFNLLIIIISFEIFFFLVGDSIQSILLCLGTTTLVNTKQQSLDTLKSQFASNYAMNTSSPKRILLIHSINILLLVIIVILYAVRYPSSSDPSQKDSLSFSIGRVLHMLQLIGMIVISFIVYTLKYYKQKLMENDYYSSNLVIQATYNLNVAKIIFFNDFLTYKSIIDFVINFPTLLYVCLKRFSVTSLVVTYICFLAYFVFAGGIFSHFDKVEKVDIPKALKRIFLFKRMKFDFTKEKAKLFEEFLLDVDSTSKLFDDFSPSKIEVFNEIGDDDEDEGIGSKKNGVKAHHNNFISYYTIFSSLWQFFSENQLALEDTNTNSNRQKQVNASYKYSIESIYQEDDDLLDEFTKSYPMKSSHEFKLDLYTSESLIKLYKLSQIGIKDIMASLEPESNRETAKSFADKRSSDKSFNCFTTHDSLLYYELYDAYHFPSREMKAYSEEYIQYLDKLNSKAQGTYLPSLLGVFKLRYCSYESIVVLFKNPLSFTPYIEMAYWLKFTLSETPERVNMSSTSSTAIDISSIDMKNNIKFNKEKVIAIRNQIETDLNALQSFPYLSYARVNVFVLKESKSFNSKMIESFDDLYGKNSLLSENSRRESHLADSDEKLKASFESVTRKELNINTLNSFDILYSKQMGQQSFLCKIFLSDLFRSRIEGDFHSTKVQKHRSQSKQLSKSYYSK